jgi:hypothetical protein
VIFTGGQTRDEEQKRFSVQHNAQQISSRHCLSQIDRETLIKNRVVYDLFREKPLKPAESFVNYIPHPRPQPSRSGCRQAAILRGSPETAHQQTEFK